MGVPHPPELYPPYLSTMRRGPDFDNFGRRMNDNDGNYIPESSRLSRTNAGKRRRREMMPMFEASGRM